MSSPSTILGGIKINLVSRTFLDPMGSAEKIRFVLDEVHAGKVLVLERGLTSTEETQLIEATMSQIEPDGFTGIEMQSYGRETPSRWSKLLRSGGLSRPRMVVIGPANTLRNVSKDSHSLEAVLVAPEGGAPEA